jgi:hypothetical protein
MKLVSSYDNTNDMAIWRAKSENEARSYYDAARHKITDLAFDLKSIEEDIIDGMADMDDATATMAFITDKVTELSALYVECHRWKLALIELGVDP